MLFVWFTLGLVAGGFLNLLIARLPVGKPVFAWPVTCAACGSPGPAIRLSAILTYLLGHSACQECGSRFDLRDLLVELGTGLLFAVLYWRFGLSVPLLVYSLYICIFVVAFMTDIKHRLIPNAVTFPGIALALPLGFIIPGLDGLSSLLGGVFYGGLFLLFYLAAMAIYRSRVVAFGLGDVKLALVIGLITGLKGAMMSALIGTTIGGFLAVIMLLTRRASLRSVMPYGPGLIIGAVLTIIWSPWIV